MFRWSVFYEMWMECDSVEEKAELRQAIMEYGLFGTEPPKKFKRDFVNVRFILEKNKSLRKKRSDAWKKWWAPEWNSNAVKNWEIIWKQAKQTKQTKTSKTSEIEIEREIEKESIYNPQEAELKIQQGINSIKAERIWNLILKKWNEVMDKHEVMSTELKNRCFNFETVDMEHIEKIMKNYKRIRDKTIEKWLESLFYFQLTEWQLVDFLKFMNKLDWSYQEVIPRLAKGDCKEIAIRKLKS